MARTPSFDHDPQLGASPFTDVSSGTTACLAAVTAELMFVAENPLLGSDCMVLSNVLTALLSDVVSTPLAPLAAVSSCVQAVATLPVAVANDEIDGELPRLVMPLSALLKFDTAEHNAAFVAALEVVVPVDVMTVDDELELLELELEPQAAVASSAAVTSGAANASVRVLRMGAPFIDDSGVAPCTNSKRAMTTPHVRRRARILPPGARIPESGGSPTCGLDSFAFENRRAPGAS